MSPIVAYTTRPQRNGEIPGVTYNFITEKDFMLLKSDGFFAETSSYKVSNGDIWHYGTAKRDLTDNKVMIANPESFNVLCKIENIHPISFYLNTSESIIWERLMNRKDDIGEAQRRIIADRDDFWDIEQKVDFVFKNNGEVEPHLLANMIKYIYDNYIHFFMSN